MSNFKAYSKYYDLLYKDKNYKAESDYVHALINKYSIGSKLLLELGCGSGNHAQHLSKIGYHITGIERSEEMLNEAVQKNIQNFTPVLADISEYKLQQKFDVAISLFHVVSYLNSNKDLINCFKSVNESLVTDGIFIFDVWFAPSVYWLKPENRTKELEDEYIKIYRQAESKVFAEKNIVDVHFTTRVIDKANNSEITITEHHPMRCFSVPEIDLLALQTGFKLLHAEEFMSGNTPSENTWGVCFILKKIN